MQGEGRREERGYVVSLHFLRARLCRGRIRTGIVSSCKESGTLKKKKEG